MKRCFVSLEVPSEVREKTSEIQRRLPDFKGKVTEFENIHLTLKFLGEISDEKIEEVKSSLREVGSSSFEVSIDDIGVFSKNYVRIIWLHLANCEEIQKKVDEVLEKAGFEKERRFMSHVTIARVKGLKISKEEFLKELRKVKIPSIKFNAKKFSLVKSELFKEGPRYETLESYNLD
ncbi:MAG: RNA 2',3'-cyclic phosphodiesterase [Candidatus Pacearchaeota archaeon]